MVVDSLNSHWYFREGQNGCHSSFKVLLPFLSSLGVCCILPSSFGVLLSVLFFWSVWLLTPSLMGGYLFSFFCTVKKWSCSIFRTPQHHSAAVNLDCPPGRVSFSRITEILQIVLMWSR